MVNSEFPLCVFIVIVLVCVKMHGLIQKLASVLYVFMVYTIMCLVVLNSSFVFIKSSVKTQSFKKDLNGIDSNKIIIENLIAQT